MTKFLKLCISMLALALAGLEDNGFSKEDSLKIVNEALNEIYK